MNQVLDILSIYPGPGNVNLQITCPDRLYRLKLAQVRVICNDELMAELETLLGSAGKVSYETNGQH